jgi:fibrillarin-like pre-rRNA processing protein
VEKLREVHKGVYSLGRYLLTKNLVPGSSTYGEELVRIGDTEYREWNPNRSKMAAALKKGLAALPLAEGDKILYLGSAEGTTISHISDIVGSKGLVFGVDISAKAMQKFLYLCESRENLVPILGDAAQPHSYKEKIGDFAIDLLYQDVSQREQAAIFLKNARVYLKQKGYGILAIKARSISAGKKTEDIIKEEISKLKKEFEIIKTVSLEPYDREHALVLCRRK